MVIQASKTLERIILNLIMHLQDFLSASEHFGALGNKELDVKFI